MSTIEGKPHPSGRLAGALLGTVMLAGSASAEVRLAAVFADGMVVQRDRPIPVWGWADEGETVKISVFDKGKTPLAAAEATGKGGRFRLTLPPLPAGGRYTWLVEGRNSMATLTDVLVGEVWITCGQSNAMWPVELTDTIEEARRDRDRYPLIRHLEVGSRTYREAAAPREALESYWGRPRWEDSRYSIMRSNEDIPGCQSAIGYYFARALSRHLGGKVPVGTIDIGAIIRVESWVDDASLAADPALAEAWRNKPYPHESSRAFNANIAPLAPFPVRGAIYYQGEMNGGEGDLYRRGLTALIASWRKAWEDPDLPVLVVQLPGFITHVEGRHAYDMDAGSLAKFKENTADHGFVPVRQAQFDTWRTVPRTGLAVTLDLGEPFDIHPRRKQAVAERLLLQARQVAYGESGLVASGPVAKTFTPIDRGFVIQFDSAGAGLEARGGELRGFEVAGTNRAFVAAKAVIDQDRVRVQAEIAGPPTAVRYAWQGFPPVTLYNKEGLPAPPFLHAQP